MNTKLIEVYVRLVKEGRRALAPNENGIPLVPNEILPAVQEALNNETVSN